LEDCIVNYWQYSALDSLSSGEAIFFSAFGGESRLVFVCIYKHAT